jgi:DNA-directed RNA polymerase subunit RPC12/RpoP
MTCNYCGSEDVILCSDGSYKCMDCGTTWKEVVDIDDVENDKTYKHFDREDA